MKKIIFILLMLCQTFIVGKADVAKRDFKDIVKSLEIKELRNTEFSIDNLYKYLKLTNVPDPEIVIAQFIVETGWFKSFLFKKGNNISGMKKATKRATTCIGTISGYAKFSHWTSSVDDFKLWLDYHGLSEGYFKHLQSKKYSESSGYYTLIIKVHKRIINKGLLIT